MKIERNSENRISASKGRKRIILLILTLLWSNTLYVLAEPQVLCERYYLVSSLSRETSRVKHKDLKT